MVRNKLPDVKLPQRTLTWMISDRIFSVARNASSPSKPISIAAEPRRLPPPPTLPLLRLVGFGRTGAFRSTRSHTLDHGLDADSSTEALTPLKNVSSCSRLRACLRATWRRDREIAKYQNRVQGDARVGGSQLF